LEGSGSAIDADLRLGRRELRAKLLETNYPYIMLSLEVNVIAIG